jgi:hypothetical protein
MKFKDILRIKVDEKTGFVRFSIKVADTRVDEHLVKYSEVTKLAGSFSTESEEWVGGEVLKAKVSEGAAMLAFGTGMGKREIYLLSVPRLLTALSKFRQTKG